MGGVEDFKAACNTLAARSKEIIESPERDSSARLALLPTECASRCNGCYRGRANFIFVTSFSRRGFSFIAPWRIRAMPAAEMRRLGWRSKNCILCDVLVVPSFSGSVDLPLFDHQTFPYVHKELTKSQTDDLECRFYDAVFTSARPGLRNVVFTFSKIPFPRAGFK